VAQDSAARRLRVLNSQWVRVPRLIAHGAKSGARFKSPALSEAMGGGKYAVDCNQETAQSHLPV
jgi:hypothetical protein